MKVLSLFDGMSCGHLALDKAGIDVDAYVASEVKEFAIDHTDRKYPDTIKAGDVTKLHYENGKLYKDCKRWVLVKDKNVVPFAQRLKNKDCFKVEGNREFVDVTSLEFDKDFDKNNRMLADYKDDGLVLNASTLSNEEVDEYKQEGFEILPNGEIAKWELGECIFEGEFDMLIGGSPCQNFSMASATNDEKYGLEGSKSRLFFDYLRLKMEVSPKYFFLENVYMKKDSKDMLDDFLGVKGIPMNSDKFSIQSRPRIYWTNLASSEPASSCKNEEIDFQNHMLRTLDKFEYALYVKRFPGSYFGYADGTPEKAKGGFVFDEKVSSTTKRLGDVVEGTIEDIKEKVTSDENNEVVVSFTDEEASKIANMPCNQWARKELEDAYGPMSDREFVEEIHKQLYDAIVKKSPSRDGMRYGKIVNGSNFSHCKDITNESKMSCITRKQDRFPNSGLITFGPYCRFVTKIEICKGQTVPYKFLADLSYEQVQDVCGDGWTVDVIAAFFENIKTGKVYNEENVHTINKEESCNKKEGEESMSKEKVTDVFDLNEVESDAAATSNANDSNANDNSKVGRGKYKVKTTVVSVPDDKEAIRVMREALRPWEKDYVPEDDARKVDATAEDVLAIVRREFGEDAYEKIQYELFGWDKIKKERKGDAPDYVVEKVANEVRDAIKNGTPFTDELKEKALWLL